MLYFSTVKPRKVFSLITLEQSVGSGPWVTTGYCTVCPVVPKKSFKESAIPKRTV